MLHAGVPAVLVRDHARHADLSMTSKYVAVAKVWMRILLIIKFNFKDFHSPALFANNPLIFEFY